MIVSRIVIDVKRALQEVLDAMQNRITFAENFNAMQKDAVSPSVADTEFTVVHNLGKTPRHYIYNVDVAAVVYDSRRSDWTESLMYLKCNQPSTTITLTIL